MRQIRSFLGRRQFLLASMTSVAALGLGKAARFFWPGTAGASEKNDAAVKKSLKGIVVYYSATGATGKIAGAIHRGMKSVFNCDVAPLNKMDPKEMAKYDVVAIGGPIWYYRETANLRLYIYNMPRMTGKPCILFCTHGTQPSGFFNSLMQPVRNKELTVIGWNDWYGGASHVLHMPSPYVTDGHPDEIDLKEAEAFGRSMAERAQRIYAGEKDLIPEIPSGPDADPLWEKSGMGGGGGGMPGAGTAAGGEGGQGGPGGAMPGAPAAGAAGAQAGNTPGSSIAGRAGGPQVGGAQGDSAGVAQGGMPGRGTGGGGSSDASEAGGRGGGGPGGMMGSANEIPKIDMAKCVYPRCTACVDNCVEGAIDFSRATSASLVSESSILVEGCIHCSQPMCERACLYDAITYKQMKTKHVYDMKKCTYPKCTLCIDNCPMNSIDFSNAQRPIVHNNCEGCDLCWCICPYDAISIPNIAETHALLANSETSWDSSFLANLNQAEKTGRFRRLTPIDKVGWGNIVYKNPNAPRVMLHEENYPYEVKN
jgi:Fe-S-cluster-containing hydrogenase component 2/flavodoxin